MVGLADFIRVFLLFTAYSSSAVRKPLVDLYLYTGAIFSGRWHSDAYDVVEPHDKTEEKQQKSWHRRHEGSCRNFRIVILSVIMWDNKL